MLGSEKADASATGEVYHTTDGGRSWAPLTATGWQGKPDFVDSRTGWVAAHHADQKARVFSNDGGLNWKELKPVIGE